MSIADALPYLAFFLYLALMFFLALRNIKILTNNERLVIFRLGKYYKAAGPGMVFLLPIIDRGRIINLDGVLPGWKGMSRNDREDAIHAYVGENIDFLMK